MDNKMMVGGAIVIIVIIIVGALILTGSGSKPQQSASLPATSVAYTSTVPVTSTANVTTVATTITVGTTQSFSVNVAHNATVGNYLTNNTGWTLYLYTSDTPGSGLSTCYSVCAKYWFAFYTSNLIVPSSLNASYFSTINRTDGTKQLTYKGWPLYYYSGDHRAYQLSGQGLLGTWYVLTVPNLTNVPK